MPIFPVLLLIMSLVLKYPVIFITYIDINAAATGVTVSSKYQHRESF